jgi:hypothetical protein
MDGAEEVAKLHAMVSGAPGEPVPQVDPEDVRAVWKLGQDVKKDHPGVEVAIGMALFEAACKPGAEVKAVVYRANHMWILQFMLPGIFEPWTKDGELTEPVFRAAAQVPMEWMAVGVVRHRLPFDADDFMRIVAPAHIGS